MQQLKTKYKLAISYSLFFFAFLVVFSLMVYILLKLILNYETNKEIVREIHEVTANHISATDNKIQFIKDKKGETLRQDFFTDGISAIFFDQSNIVVRKYGLFETNNSEELKNMASILTNINNVKSTGKMISSDTDWNNQELISYYVPLISKNTIIGSMIIGKPEDSNNQIAHTVLLILASLGIFGLMGSFIIGMFMANQSLKPLKFIVASIEQTDLEGLDKKVGIGGHPDDEITVLAKKYNQMLERLDAMSKKQKDFIANASHELKTPMAKAITSLDLILAGVKSVDELNIIKFDLLEISSTIDHLLALSRVKDVNSLPSGVSSIQKTYLKIKAKLQDDIKIKNITVRDLMPDLYVPLPHQYLEIIINNLMLNAVKYCAENGEIAVYSSAENGQKHFSIINTNHTGLLKPVLAKVFDRFYRGGSLNKFPGYGIGLHLVKEVCDLYKVKISFESDSQKTTCRLLFS